MNGTRSDQPYNLFQILKKFIFTTLGVIACPLKFFFEVYKDRNEKGKNVHDNAKYDVYDRNG
ncbi:hypothetical protein J2TS6_54420 [Paenibacillus albilobatus]|uniref:Uncharacterized protein n=1 Tax=Paenibacillus albilobatus TaxID=2716884 RepID=A0A920CC48_9BACL|nr:hypothetical protein J2TS6_54420 [Paenibacillus albilobatus]